VAGGQVRDRLRVAYRLRKTDAQLVDKTRGQHPRIIEPGAVGGQARVLDPGDERPEIELRGRIASVARQQAACPWSASSLNLPQLKRTKNESFSDTLWFDPSREHVVGDTASLHSRGDILG
jgi:hypothetical protein